MSSFWKAEGKIPIEQTSKAVSVLNGLDFSGGQELRIKVPPTTKFIKPDECYLQGDFKISMDTSGATDYPTLLQLDERLGGQSLIREISIYSSAEKGSVLLEQISNYNTMVSVMRDYDTNDTDKRKRAMTEGATIWIPQTRGTLGTTRSEAANCTATNPYFQQVVNGSGNKVAVFDSDSFTTCKLCLPLETGIFRNNKVWVNMLTGLEIVITLEDAERCVRPLDSTLRNRRLKLNPVFHSLNGSTVPDTWLNGSASDRFYIKKDNTNLTPALCPFVVGEKINFVSPTNASASAFSAGAEILSINASSTADGGDGLLEVVLTASITLTSATAVAEGWYVYSDSIADSAGLYKPTYSFSNVELVVQEVDMGSTYVSDVLGSMKEKGVIVHDVLSAQNYRYSQSSTDTVANIRLPLTNARGKSIICVPTDSTTYTAKQRLSCTDTYETISTADLTLNSADQFRGVSDHITDYQFIYDGRLQPSRPVRCSKTSSDISIDAQPLIETTKALVQADISAKSLASFNSNFCVSRALALNKGVYDTRNKDFNLQVNYQETTAPTKNKLWNNYIFHLRRINIRQDSISVEY
tara:strand:- start:10129 stop:11874 length:1746 start_codon:yes stop_codon:yes gene_type:complete